MIADKGVIVFGGREYEVQAFTFDQLQEVAQVVTAFGVGRPLAEEMPDILRLLSAALGLSDEDVRATPTTAVELASAVAAIVRISGLSELGNGPAPTPPADSTGATSTPTS